MRIKKGYKQLLAEAEAQIETLTVEQAIAEHGKDNVVFVDLRDPRELDREGKMPGAFSCTRGMLEFWIDPESPYHKPIFAEDKRFIFFCAGGWRSALAAKTAKTSPMSQAASAPGRTPAARRNRLSRERNYREPDHRERNNVECNDRDRNN
jgi:rhodanese-related sulfurtransferase